MITLRESLMKSLNAVILLQGSKSVFKLRRYLLIYYLSELVIGLKFGISRASMIDLIK